MSGSSNSLATRLRQVRLARRADTAPRKAATWDLVKVAFLVPGLSIIAIVVVLGVVRLLAGDGLSGIMSATAAGWLAVNQVPVTISGVTLGVLPLLPTLLVCAGTVKVIAEGASTARELPDLVGIVGAAIGGSVLVTALSLAVVADGAAVSAVGQPDPLSAFGYTILIQGAAVLVGIAIPSLRPILDEFAVPATERVGARGGVIAFGVLVAGGALLVFGSIVMHWGSVSRMIADGNTFDGYLGLTGLSILYLPNLVVGAAAVTTGTTAQLGDTVLDAFDVSRGAVPPLPVVSALPETGLGGLGVLLFIVPLAAGVLLGWYCRSTDPIRHLRAVAIGAAVAAALVVVASWVSGGRLGELGRTGVNTATAGVFTFAWLMLAGALVVGVMWAAGGGITRARNGEDDLDSWLDDVATHDDESADDESADDEDANDEDSDDETETDSPSEVETEAEVETDDPEITDELELDPVSDPEPDRRD
ncbi:DUF6350 family protein [Gordonia sp. HY442]|uniref:cell division protein PerM n=1 Tax=Gordonia zhenghanii TaxID=2911516 RepID=UPI001F41B489|nr:DUF6350 family protein [Gordonia zhenghanii]MCF8605326.1 DUF6350 family protein [Gordonia zhenghanii]